MSHRQVLSRETRALKNALTVVLLLGVGAGVLALWLDYHVVGAVILLTTFYTTYRMQGRYIQRVVDTTTQSLHENEQWLTMSQQVAHLGHYVFNIREGVWTSSDSLNSVFGIPHDYPRTLGGWAKLIHPDDQTRTLAYLQAQIISGTSFDLEYRIIRKSDNVVRYVHGIGGFVRDPRGHALQMFGTIQDITDKKAAEEAIKAERDKLEQYLNIAQVILVAVDDQARITILNRKGYEVLKHPEGSLIGSDWFDTCLPPEEREEAKAVYRRLMANDLTLFERYETHVVTSDGVRRLVSWHHSLLKDKNTCIIGTLSSGEDVTERREQETVLRHEQLFSERVIESLPGIFYAYDEDLRLRRWNKNFQTILGYSDEDLLGSVIGSRNDPKDFARTQAMIRPVLTGEREYVAFETELVSKSGKKVPFLVTATRLEGEDGSRMLIGVGIDISDSRRLEAKLHQAQKMESIGRLAGGIAHDFNNMLGVILGCSQMAALDAPDGSELQAILNDITRAALRSRDITKQLLAFSRKEVISPRSVDLNAVIVDAGKNLTRLIGEEIQFSFNPTADLWRVNIDPSQVEQAMMNLSVNARDAMPKGGRLIFETSNKIIDSDYCLIHPEAEPGEYVEMSVSDSGGGIPPEIKAHIFEPFFTTKPAGVGTGLGLATVYGIVTQNKGFITVYSEQGIGTVFRLYFPRFYGEDRVDAPKQTPLPLKGTGHILLVEDEEMLLSMVKKVLEKIGYTVTAFTSPRDAVTAFAADRGKYDLVLTDVVMPWMNGKELVERLHELRPDLRVIFMSGYTSDIVTQRGVLEKGMNYIQKPIDISALHQKIQQVLN